MTDLAVIQPPIRSISEIERDDIVCRTLEAAARHLETKGGNPSYTMAWKVAAKDLRAMKP